MEDSDGRAPPMRQQEEEGGQEYREAKRRKEFNASLT